MQSEEYYCALMSLFSRRTLRDIAGHRLSQLHSQSRMVRVSFAFRSRFVRGSLGEWIREPCIGDAVLLSPTASKSVKNCTHYSAVGFCLACSRPATRSPIRGFLARPRRSPMALRRSTRECGSIDSPVIALRTEQHLLQFRRISRLPSMAPTLSAAMLSRVRSEMLRCLPPTFPWLRRII